MEDARKAQLRKGLEQLSMAQLLRLRRANPNDICWDTYHFDETTGQRCIMGYALDIKDAGTDRRMIAKICEQGFKLFPMSGVEGDFYTTERHKDMLSLVDEILSRRCNNA